MENKVIKTTAKRGLRRKLEGEVTSDKMDKTVSVLVTSIKTHSKYKKQYNSSKKYKAHDENNEYKVDDKVVIEGCRPISKDKRWRVIKKVK